MDFFLFTDFLLDIFLLFFTFILAYVYQPFVLLFSSHGLNCLENLLLNLIVSILPRILDAYSDKEFLLQVYLGEQYVNNATLSDVTFLVEGC